MLSIDELKNIKDKVVIVRVDFNVPLKEGKVRDDNRIKAALPTINKLLNEGAKVVLLSHLGKVKHKETPEVVAQQKAKNNMAIVVDKVSENLGKPVKFCPAVCGDEFVAMVNELKSGEVLLVQNTRYEKGEEKNDPALAESWASVADAYVMDAFGSAHRAHASTYGIPEILKNNGKQVAVGYLVKKEVDNLTRCVDVKDSDRPYVAILGGLKVSDKIKVIDSLLKKCDKIIIGGAMAYTFQKALGHTIGNSPVENEQLEYARHCLEAAKGKIVLPLDSVVTNAFEGWTEKKVVDLDIPEGYQGMDIGPKTVELFANEISKAKMIFWNGPMGVFEQKDFQAGTKAVCESIAKLGDSCFSVCGGGDSAAAVKEFGYKDKFAHVSTGGGASLEMIENDGHLPGVDILKQTKEIKIVRRKLLMGNWKMNKTNQEAKEFVEACGPIVELAKQNNIDIGVAPTFLALCCTKKHAPEGLIVSSQNVHHLSSGAYTGEVSTEMLSAIGVDWAIIGHSERRTYNNETSEACNLKIKKLLESNMTPLYCCGESLETYEKGETKVFIKEQIVAGFKDLCPKCARKVVIAYEPIWSIGTGKNASKEIAEDICSYIRSIIKDLFDQDTADCIRILYGGSVKPINIREYLSSPNIDGALVGGASLKIDSFKELLTNII